MKPPHPTFDPSASRANAFRQLQIPIPHFPAFFVASRLEEDPVLGKSRGGGNPLRFRDAAVPKVRLIGEPLRHHNFVVVRGGTGATFPQQEIGLGIWGSCASSSRKSRSPAKLLDRHAGDRHAGPTLSQVALLSLLSRRSRGK